MDSYLIQSGVPGSGVARQKHRPFLSKRFAAARLLGIPYLVTHPGAHVGQGEEVGLARVAESLDIVHEQGSRRMASRRAWKSPRAGKFAWV